MRRKKLINKKYRIINFRCLVAPQLHPVVLYPEQNYRVGLSKFVSEVGVCWDSLEAGFGASDAKVSDQIALMRIYLAAYAAGQPHMLSLLPITTGRDLARRVRANPVARHEWELAPGQRAPSAGKD